MQALSFLLGRFLDGGRAQIGELDASGIDGIDRLPAGSPPRTRAAFGWRTAASSS
jgi:hypothetical protein